MSKKSVLSTSSAMLVAIIWMFASVFADQKIYDSYGIWTGLTNVNPDPAGEPWIVGGYKPISAAEEAEFQEMTIDPSRLRQQLPLTVDNTKNPEFRPIFNQVGGSCAQASSVAYIYTYEMNLLRKLASNTPGNQFPYGYTYDFVNGGSTDNGSSPTQGWNIIKTTGCPSVTDYGGTLNGGLNGSAWMKTYQAYHNANNNRTVTTMRISELTVPANLLKLKNFLYNHANESEKGGCVVFSSYHGFDYDTIKSGPFANQKIALIQSGSVDHCMTFAGYSDEVGYDFNGDGKITNDLNVNGDSIIDVQDYEQGALLLVNSWGTSFGNGGKVWLAYRSLAAIAGKSVNYPTVSLFKPVLELKVNFTHDTRNALVVKAGFSSNLSATTPTETKGFANAFNKSGGAYPLEGNGGSTTIEIGLDVSDYAAKFVGGKGVVFLQIVSTGGTGQVNSLSAMDYSISPTSPVETKCSQTNVPITGTINLGIPVTLAGTPIKPSLPVNQDLPFVKIESFKKGVILTLSSQEPCKISIANPTGKIVRSFSTTPGQIRYSLGEGLSRGVYTVTAVSRSNILSRKITIF